MNILQQWQTSHLARLRKLRPSFVGPRNVTTIAYHFWDEYRIDQQFDYLECSLRETWRHCGMMETVVVVNKVTTRLEAFAADFSEWVKLDVAPQLEPGSLYLMSVDCNEALHKRFDTEYALIVQNDGFPIRSGLECFLGKWDFIGAPYVRNTWRNRLVCNLMGCWVSNGGFSLRSKKICEMAAYYWRKKYAQLPDSRQVSEDVFYTETLPLREREYRKAVRIADYSHALSFSYDAAFPYQGTVSPFGFHGVKAFESLFAAGWVSE